MSGVGVIFCAILWIIEHNIFSRFRYFLHGLFPIKLSSAKTNTPIDIDVQNEKIKINKMVTDDFRAYSLVLRNLTKYYGNFLAVNRICVAVER